MALCVTVDQSGYIVQSAQQADPADCYAVLLSGADYGSLLVPDFAALGITPTEVLAVLSWGFGGVIVGWCLGLAGGWAAGAIKRI